MHIEYRPSGGTLDRFHADQAFMRILLGPLGSGKTTASCYEILRRALSQAPDQRGVRATRWLVCRNTLPELETTTLPSWRQHFGTELGMWKMTTPVTHIWRFPLDDGTRVEADIFFLGLDGDDAANKIRGMELTGAWVNEMKDVPRSVIDMITGRVGRFPARKSGGPSWFGIIGDTNMPDDDHWMYKLAEITRPDGWSFFRQPGGVLKVGDKWVINANAENMENLPRNYYQNQLAGKSEEWVRVYLAAEYGYVSDGRPVFPEYSDIHHVDEFEAIESVNIDIGADFGLTPAAVFLQRDTWGRYLVLEELVTDDVGAKDFALAIKRFMAAKFPGHRIGETWGDPIGEKRQAGDDDARTTFQIMAANGVPFRPAPGNNQLVLRREAVAGPLTRLVDGKPGLIINRRCVKLRAALSGKYNFRRVALKSDVFADKPQKNEYSHIAEALEYIMLGVGEGREAVDNKFTKIERPKVITGTKFRHHVARRRMKPGHAYN